MRIESEPAARAIITINTALINKGVLFLNIENFDRLYPAGGLESSTISTDTKLGSSNEENFPKSEGGVGETFELDLTGIIGFDNGERVIFESIMAIVRLYSIFRNSDPLVN